MFKKKFSKVLTQLLALNIQMFAYDNKIDRSGAEALIPEDASKEIIQGIPQYSAVMQLATKAPNMSRKQRRVPVLSSLPTAYFVDGDTGLKQTTQQMWANKYFNAEELAVIIPIPEAVLDDADYDIWGEVKPRIMEAMGIAFDKAVFFGVNAPQSWPSAILTSAASAGKVVTLGTGTDLYEDLLGENGVISLVESAGYMCTGHVGAMSMRGKYRGLRDGDKQPLFKTSMQGSTQYDLDGSPIVFPRNGAMDATQALQFSGDFKQIVYAMRQDITYKILDQAVIQDNAGNIIYNLAQQDMVALRAVIRLAWQVPNPISSFAPDEAVRYPIGVLLPSTGSGALTVTSVAGTASGDTKVTVTGTTGGTLKYKTGAAITAPAVGTNLSADATYTAFVSGNDYTATTGNIFVVVELDGTGRVVRKGSATVASKA
jgi:HK97 family phage major capsid protein